MFQTGEYVVYGFSGVCLVESITEMAAPGSGEKQQYYVLSPIKTKENRVYAPIQSKKPLRAVMTREEAEVFLESIPDIEPLQITSDKRREDEYKEVMKTCDYTQWVRIIKTLYLRKEERIGRGKQITAVDGRYWKAAEEYLYGELSVALGMEITEVEEYLLRKFDQKK